MSGSDDPRRVGQAEDPAASGAESGSRPTTPPQDRPRDAAPPRDAAARPRDLPDDGDLPDNGDLPDDGDLPLVDEVDLRELVRGAMRAPPAAPPSLLRGVQQRIRTRSRGKFYGDGWSTARSPRSTYLMTSLFMLALIAFVFMVLVPWSGGALP
ncbi:hypothetical protein WMF18_36825 [Sorangium sp. So ce315]|uniref:hypothetical protein n=1 Tax=Sorangium sp. So ce315 TaxID=3133299 RepID=UPI003F5DA0FE